MMKQRCEMANYIGLQSTFQFQSHRRYLHFFLFHVAFPSHPEKVGEPAADPLIGKQTRMVLHAILQKSVRSDKDLGE